MFDTYEAVFAARADTYHAAMKRWPVARDAEFRMVLDPLGDLSGKTVWDMPSGGGYLRHYLPAGARYMAVEPSALFFDACPVDDRADRVMASIDAVPRPDGAADHIVSLAGLHHAPDLAPVFAEMRRLLAPGGRLVIADVAVGTTADGMLNDYVHRHNPMGHEGRFLDGATAGLLAAAGFAIVEDAIQAVPWRFATAEDAGGYCSALFGLEGVSPLAVADALTAYCGRIDADGGIVIPWPLRRIVCVRRA